MRPWLIPVAAGVAAVIVWILPPLLDVARLYGDRPAVVAMWFERTFLREGVAAFVFGFAVACAALAYRNTLSLRHR